MCLCQGSRDKILHRPLIGPLVTCSLTFTPPYSQLGSRVGKSPLWTASDPNLNSPIQRQDNAMDLKANATLTHLQLASQIFSVNVELCRNGPYLPTYHTPLPSTPINCYWHLANTDMYICTVHTFKKYVSYGGTEVCTEYSYIRIQKYSFQVQNLVYGVCTYVRTYVHTYITY